nr:AAA family ATPase [Methylorubrum zatmanii]
MTKHAASSAAAVRAVALDPRPFAGPRDGRDTRTRVQLLYGGGMAGHSAIDDLRARLQPLRGAAGLRERTLSAIESAFEDATVGRISTLERMLASEVLRNSLPVPTLALVRDVGGVLVFHLAELGCELASARLAAELLSMAAAQVRAAQLDRAFLMIRHALLRAEDAQCPFREIPYVPGPSYPRLESFDVEAAAWIKAWSVIGKAVRMIEDEDDILRGGAGQQAEPAPQNGDFDFGLPAPPPEAAPARTVEAILSDAKASREAPSLVVVPSLDHLPKPSSTGQQRRDTPRAEFEVIAGKALPLAPPVDPQVLVEDGVRRYPFARTVLETIASDLVGARHTWIQPTLIASPPGLGKTSLVSWLGALLGLRTVIYGAGGASDASFGGTSRQWGTGRGCLPLQVLLQAVSASALINLDELDKASLDRRNGALADVLLPFLERSTNARILDPYLETEVNLSGVSYLATVNDLSRVPSALRDRFRVIEMPAPRADDLPIIAAGMVEEMRQERGVDPAWMPDLSPDEIALIPWEGGSLRPLRRMIQAVLASRETFAPRH